MTEHSPVLNCVVAFPVKMFFIWIYLFLIKLPLRLFPVLATLSTWELKCSIQMQLPGEALDKTLQVVTGKGSDVMTDRSKLGCDQR